MKQKQDEKELRAIMVLQASQEAAQETKRDRLYQQIGKLQVKMAWL